MKSLHTLQFDVSKYINMKDGWYSYRHYHLPVYHTFEFALLGSEPKIEQVQYLPPYSFLFTISGQQARFARVDVDDIALARPCYKRMSFMIIPDRGEVFDNWTHGLTFEFWYQHYHLIYPKEFKND